jgi:hypothetical protein
VGAPHRALRTGNALINGDGACDYGRAKQVMRDLRRVIEDLARQGTFLES